MPDDQEPDGAPGADGGPVKTFLEHLEDLRWVMVKSAIALTLGMLICLIGANYVMAIIKWPLQRAPALHPGTNQIVSVHFGGKSLDTFTLTEQQQQALALGTNRYVAVEIEPVIDGTNRFLTWRINPDPATIEEMHHVHVDLVNLSPAGGFIVAFQVAFYGGMVMAAPFIFYFIAGFIFPALRMREQRYVYRGLAIGVVLFLTGVSFCYFILMPVALAASQLYSQWLGLGAFEWRAEDYISFVCKFMLGMGLGFELPVVILILVKIGVLNYDLLSKGRRYMIVICLVLGALLTTPEVLTQVLMAVPLYILYEVSVWIAWYWERQERKREALDI
jgi:sec-independent protein translocase protein TatC